MIEGKGSIELSFIADFNFPLWDLIKFPLPLSPQNNNPHEWLQVDLWQVKRITGVVTQGARSMLTQMMVTEFSVTVSVDGHSWSSVLEESSQREKVQRALTNMFCTHSFLHHPCRGPALSQFPSLLHRWMSHSVLRSWRHTKRILLKCVFMFSDTLFPSSDLHRKQRYRRRSSECFWPASVRPIPPHPTAGLDQLHRPASGGPGLWHAAGALTGFWFWIFQ